MATRLWSRLEMLYMTKSLSNKLYLKRQLYRLLMNEGTVVLEHLNFFNKVINKLLAVDVKINEEDKALTLLSSLSKSYDHIITIMLYGKETLILKEVTLSYLMIRQKAKSRGANRIRFGDHEKERKRRRKERSRFVKCVSLLS